MTIGEQIRFIRKHMGLTQKELGQLSNTSETTIKQYELGKRTPRIEQLQKIAHALGGSVSEIFILDTEETSEENLETYYLNEETTKMAQSIFENKELRLLFDAAQDASPDDLQTVHNMLLALKKKERKEFQ